MYNKTYDVGVIVGRFQVHELHEAHEHLIDSVVDKHNKVIVFLGLSPCRVTINNPLDFESRKQMILDKYPNVVVLYIKDSVSDKVWSKNLDSQIFDIAGCNESVVLYGGRDGFIKHYAGQFDTRELENQEIFVSGTKVRKEVSVGAKSNGCFRRGVIWAAYNQYPKSIPTVDVAIWDENRERLLMARKPDEEKYRFVGGFAQGGTYEATARREVMEETHLEIGDITYLGSFVIDDWRYKREQDNIVTLFFECKRVFGKPTPDDDICELKWFDFNTMKETDIVDNHVQLFKCLKSSTIT